MSLGVREGTVAGVEGRVDALLEIARHLAELVEGDSSSFEAIFIHGVSVGMRMGGMASETECLGIERAALLRRHGRQTSLEELAFLDDVVTENARRILSGVD